MLGAAPYNHSLDLSLEQDNLETNLETATNKWIAVLSVCKHRDSRPQETLLTSFRPAMYKPVSLSPPTGDSSLQDGVGYSTQPTLNRVPSCKTGPNVRWDLKFPKAVTQQQDTGVQPESYQDTQLDESLNKDRNLLQSFASKELSARELAELRAEALNSFKHLGKLI